MGDATNTNTGKCINSVTNITSTLHHSSPPPPPPIYTLSKLPNQKNTPPNPTFTPKCCPKLHATQYKYFGENTVHTNKCVLSTAQAAITAATLPAANTVCTATCPKNTPHPPPLRSSNIVVADVQ